MRNGSYRIPPLREVRIPKDDGGERVLAIPPFRDRVLQRTVAQVIGPGLESLMSTGSYGFRRGRSRHQAARSIQRAYSERQCRWVLESDVDDCFDSVAWTRLHTRLVALFGEDPVVDWILAWMQAPTPDGNRKPGLPQGSPLSPLLAKLMLDDTDSHEKHEKAVYLISYDIPQDRLRNRIAKILGGYGQRVQCSVFEVVLRSPAQLKNLRERLSQAVHQATASEDTAQDPEPEVASIRFYRLCEHCRAQSHDLVEQPILDWLATIVL